jgi:hypothetical protein
MTAGVVGGKIMFFTRVGKVLAHLVFWCSVFRILVGVYVLFGAPDLATSMAAQRRYLGSATGGEAIDRGALWVLVAVALGVLCEISARRQKALTQE